jgi:hypothetical protein
MGSPQRGAIEPGDVDVAAELLIGVDAETANPYDCQR